jgi:hypothetical protein
MSMALPEAVYFFTLDGSGAFDSAGLLSLLGDAAPSPFDEGSAEDFLA